MPVDNSVKTGQGSTVSAPLDDRAQGTAPAVTGKPETREEKALEALKKAQAEENKAQQEENKAQPKAPPSLACTSL